MELMVALAILSIVLTLSLPSFAKWQEANEFKQALRHLTQLAESAKVAAISSQSDISVIVDINSGQCADHYFSRIRGAMHIYSGVVPKIHCTKFIKGNKTVFIVRGRQLGFKAFSGKNMFHAIYPAGIFNGAVA